MRWTKRGVTRGATILFLVAVLLTGGCRAPEDVALDYGRALYAGDAEAIFTNARSAPCDPPSPCPLPLGEGEGSNKDSLSLLRGRGSG